MSLSFPLDLSVLEQVPRNARATAVVRLSRTLSSEHRLALIESLCRPLLSPSSPSPAAVGAAAPATGKDILLLKQSLLSSTTASASSSQEPDPSHVYHLQEIGLLVAAATGEKHEILRLAQTKTSQLISDKALALAVNSPQCVLDHDLVDLARVLGERDKIKLVRLCAYAEGESRRHVLGEFVRQWLTTSTTSTTAERRLAACELLAFCAKDQDWLPPVLRDLIARGKQALHKFGAKHLDVQCFSAIRRDVLWKRHSSMLFDMIAYDLKAEQGRAVGHARVFAFYFSLLNYAEWKIPGQKTLAQQTLNNLAEFVPWRQLFELYLNHLPFEPANVGGLWTAHCAGVEDASITVAASVDEQARFKRALELVDFSEEWTNLVTLITPGWMVCAPMLRKVGSVGLLSAFDRLTSPGGVIPRRFCWLGTALLNMALQEPAMNTSSSTKLGLNDELFAKVMNLVKQTLSRMTKRGFYANSSGNTREREFYHSDGEYFLETEVAYTQTKVLDTFLIKALSLKRITVGQQLALFTELQVFTRNSLKLSLHDFPANDDLLMVSPNRIKQMIDVYEAFLQPFTTVVLEAVAGKIRRNTEQGKPQSNVQLDLLFNRLVQLGLLDVQADVEELYLALASRFPLVFGVPPTDRIPKTILPKLLKLSLGRTFESHSDEPSRICDRLLVDVVLPRMIRETSDLFQDLGANYRFAQYKNQQQDTGLVRVTSRALEEMDVIKLEWLNTLARVDGAFRTGAVSLNATGVLLDCLEKWTNISQTSVRRAKQAKYTMRNPGGDQRNDNVISAHNAEVLLRRITAFLDSFIKTRTAEFCQNEWKAPPTQLVLERLIQRAVRLWSAAMTWVKDEDPLSPECKVLDPYSTSELVVQVNALPFSIRTPFLPVVRKLFLLRLQGKIQLAGGELVDRLPRDDGKVRPWDETGEFFKKVFGLTSTSFSAPDLGAHDVLVYLERHSKTPITAFLKTLDAYMDITDSQVRKRFEQDLSRSLFADRQACIDVLLDSSVRSGSLVEISKTLVRISQAIENEQHANRVAVIQRLTQVFSQSIVPLILPSASGVGSSSDREYVLFLHSAPQPEEWSKLVDAGERLPKILFKLLADLLESTDEKQESDFKLFRTVSDELFKRAITWPCAMFRTTQIEQLQRVWFDTAMELQFKISCYRSGRVLAASTFRPMLSSSTLNTVKQFVFDSGLQMDRPYPSDPKMLEQFQLEAKQLRKQMARYVSGLFDQAYKQRVGDSAVGKPGTALMRKPAMEKKRFLDMVAMVQGEWVHCHMFPRVVDCVEQVPTAANGHQNQLVEIMQTLCEASVSWGVRCRDTRPAWARNPNLLPSLDFKGKAIGTKGEAEDVVWCQTKFFEFLPEVVPRYWKLVVETFGIHHPKRGVELGRCLLRMHVRFQLAQTRTSKLRAVRQTNRVNTALALLDICPSAIHLRLCQSVLRDFRQDLLDQHVFSHGVQEPVLGKFSALSPPNADGISGGNNNEADDDDDESEATFNAGPFRLFGFYGFHQLTYLQGRKLAEMWIYDCEDSSAATLQRVRAVNHLSFLPCVSHHDFAQVLSRHYERKLAYQAAIKLKKKNEDGELVLPTGLPLPESVVETTFQAVLGDSNPLSLLPLLDSKMMQKSSSKTTVRVAERMRVLLPPSSVLGVINLLLSRKGRDALQVGPIKALLRILFAYAQESEVVVGFEVVSRAREMITTQWSRKELHPDARIVVLVNALWCAARADWAFAWDILSEVSTNTEFPNKFRALLSTADPTHDAVGSITTQNYAGEVTQEFQELVTEANKYGRCKFELVFESRFLGLLLVARDTCQTIERTANAQLALLTGSSLEWRKRNSLIKLARNSAHVRALLSLDLIRWVQFNEADTFTVFAALSEAITQTVDNCVPNHDDSALDYLYSTTLPERLACLSNMVYSQYTTQAVTCPERMLECVKQVNAKWLNELLVALDLSQHYARLRVAKRLKSFTTQLSTSSARTSTRLSVCGFAKPFQTQIEQLKRESKVSAMLGSCLPDPFVGED
ncbi:hypothetical protein BASA81_001873 [Batrachochytrium salamandrivorans]|nr:hypothetical protein BASA81_001873 [Batrachochytrium salamandrivorans]